MICQQRCLRPCWASRNGLTATDAVWSTDRPSPRSSKTHRRATTLSGSPSRSPPQLHRLYTHTVRHDALMFGFNRDFVRPLYAALPQFGRMALAVAAYARDAMLPGGRRRASRLAARDANSKIAFEDWMRRPDQPILDAVARSSAVPEPAVPEPAVTDARQDTPDDR